MEKLLLSKLEVLAEWFMLLFFDPMYFQGKVAAIVIESATNEETSSQTVFSTIKKTIKKRVIEIPGKLNVNFIEKRERISYLIFKRYKTTYFNTKIDQKKTFLWTERIKESTLNWIQSALPIMRLNVVFE